MLDVLARHCVHVLKMPYQAHICSMNDCVHVLCYKGQHNNRFHCTAGIGDVNMAFQAFSTAVAIASDHAESLCNLGVLEVRRGNDAAAMTHFKAAQKLAQHSYEAWYNGALVSHRTGNLEESYAQVQSALEAFPEHYDSQELMRQLQASFVAV